MSAGYIQLAAIGQQDAYLTGSPQITYFSGLYRRHTPFVLEGYDIPFQGQKVVYGQNNICKIPAKGDLIRGLTLKLTLPALNNPGSDWTWPAEPETGTNQPHIRINGPATGGASTTIITTVLVSSYSTNNFAKWFTTFSPYVSYDSTQSRFLFSNCLSVEVENRSDPLAPGVFWGLDPKAPSYISPSGNLVYTVNSTSNLQANTAINTSANFISTVFRTGDFTLEQAGWVQSFGAIAANRKAGFFSYLNQPYNVSGQQFLNFTGTSGTGAVWTTPNQNTRIAATPGGRIQFQKTGLYALKAGFTLGAGSIQTLSFGSSTNEATEGSAPTVPNFETTFTFRVSPDPSMPAVIPMNVTSVSNTYYFYVTSTGTQLQANSYVSINPVDEIYKLNQPVTINTAPCKIQLAGNVYKTSDSAMVLTPTSNINFLTTGEYLLTGVVALSSGYVSNVTIYEGTSLLYDYDMRLQGRDPTFAFSMPIVVTSLTANYFMNVTTTTTTTLLPDLTYFILNRIGVVTTDQADPNILPENGISFRPSTTTLSSPLNFVSDFVASGNSAIVTYTSGGFQFSNAGTYMMTGAVCTKDLVASVTFGPQTYDVTLGIAPPYTFQIPIYVSDPSATYPVSLTMRGSSAAPNLFSNTFISVYPITSALPDPATITYPYYDSVGTWAIKTADLKIGGQTIQSLTGEFIELWNDLHVPYENQPGLTILTGKNDTSTINPPGRTYFVNLPFYFYGHPSLYLPLVALDRHDVEVHVTFRDFNELTAVTVSNPTLDATIITEYVYLSDPEINWFRKSRLDYVITQCQYQSIGLLPGFTSAVFNLDFKNPVREMFFVVQPTNQKPYDYSNNAVLSFALSFNGQDVFTPDTTDALYTGSIEPFNHYENFPQRDFYMYAFTANPGSAKPAGQINFSRIKQILLRLNCGGQAYLPAKDLRILAVNYNILRVADGLGGLLFNT
jgi:hypothetical protein